jgi:hypothetical protein
MRIIKIIVLIIFITFISCNKKSPREQSTGTIDGIAIVVVDYGAPSVKGRTIWGGLEAYGDVWRAGANGNTTVSFDKDVIISGNNLAAGTYGFFIIPNEKGDWTVIFNKENDEWGAFSYKQEEDALRINVTPSFVNDTQEQLLYSIGDNTIDFAWEKARLAIPISSK